MTMPQLIVGAGMTPTDLVQLAEVKELMKLRQFRKAINTLTYLANFYPDDKEVKELLILAQNNGVPRPPTQKEITESGLNIKIGRTVQNRIRIESISFLALLDLLLVLVVGILIAWFLIFFVFGFHFQYNTLIR